MTRSGMFQRFKQLIGGPKNLELQVSCYGKLPMYKDFLRNNLAGKEAQAFKQWLDRGISHYWSATEGYHSETIYPHAVVLRFPGTGKYVLGYLWGSHDEGELRFFPFSLFVSLPAGNESFPPHSVLECLEAIIQNGRRWHQEAADLTSHQDFVQWSRNLRLNVTIRPEQEVAGELLQKTQEMSVGDFAASLWPDSSDTEWPALLAYLDRFQQATEARLHAADLAARFPTCGRLTGALRAQIWTSIIERFDVRRDRPVHIVVPLYEERAGITLLLRGLRPDDVFTLHPDMPGYDHVEDLRRVVPRGAGDEIDPLTEPEKRQPLRALIDAQFTASLGGSQKGE